MIETIFEQLPGQHVYLFTHNAAVHFYEKLGFKKWGIGMGKVNGEWLVNNR
jgi:RimJ/RimL family protein N-acetyltransferase